MKGLRPSAVLLCACLLVPVAQADEPDPASEPEGRAATASPAEPAPSPVIYIPPRRGSPRAKTGGGVRGAVTQPQPLTLAPPHTAHTRRAAPSLYWYLEALPEHGARVVFTLAALDAIDPLVEQALPTPTRTGIQRVDLAALGVALLAETEYAWSIAIVRDAERRDLDLVDSSYLWRTAGGAAEGELPAQAGTAEWAARSLWYEALESAMAAFEADPESERARGELEALLGQAGLRRAIP